MLVGGLIIIYCSWWVGNYKSPLAYNKTTQDNSKVWGIFSGQAWKCHMGWKLGCIILLGHFNQDVICQGDSWYVWGESRGENKYLTCCVHVDGVAYNWTPLGKCYWRQPMDYL